MRIIVHQPVKPLQSTQALKIVENVVNTDLVEREHDNGEGGTTLHMQSGATVDITESFYWWKEQVMPVTLASVPDSQPTKEEPILHDDLPTEMKNALTPKSE